MIQKISTQIPKYEILEEIHATSYPAYINTEIKSGYNISIEAKYKNNNTFESGTYRRIFSTDAEWNDKRTISVNYNDSKLEVKFIGETRSFMTSVLYDTSSEHTVYLSSEYFKYDGNIELTRWKSEYTSSYDIIIAQSFYKSSLDQGYYNYYYVKIWDNDTLVRDYVPVKRLSDNKYGLYDYVNDTFYSSVGTAEFTGTSKAEPEYIYDNQAQTLYVNDIIINNTHINRIYNKGEIYWGNEYTSTPTTYTYEVLDYILLPSLAAVGTGVYPYGDMTVEMTADLGTYNSGNPRLFSTNGTNGNGGITGEDWSSNQTWGLQFESDGTKLAVKTLGISGAQGIFTFNDVTREMCQGVKKRYVLNSLGKVYVYNDDDTLFFSNTFSYSQLSSPTQTQMCLFAMGVSVREYTFTNTKVYSSKIWDGSTLIRDYLPVRRLVDDVYGFYDRINDTFHENEHTNTSDPFTGVSKSTPEYI